MGNSTSFQTVVGFVVAATTFAAATSIEAQVWPEFFLDTFDDMNAQDDAPVSWSNAYEDGGSIDASSGDLIVTVGEEENGIWVKVEEYTYDDVSVRTQVAIPPEKPWSDVSVCACADEMGVYCAGINSSTHGWLPSSLDIFGFFGGDYQDLRYVHTDLDPAQTDVFLQFDVLGDQLTLTAWAAGTTKESGQQIAYRDSRLQEGVIGLTYWQGGAGGPPLPEPTPATFRFYQAAAILPGDFNVSEVLDTEDIDLLSSEVRMGRYRPQFDLNHDKSVDPIDHEIWVHEVKNTYYGDADLNGEFNSSDMVQVFVVGKYETGDDAGWDEGDWDANGIFDSSDMVTAFVDGGYEKGLRTDAAAVPEPGGSVLLMIGLLPRLIGRRTYRAV